MHAHGAERRPCPRADELLRATSHRSALRHAPLVPLSALGATALVGCRSKN